MIKFYSMSPPGSYSAIFNIINSDLHPLFILHQCDRRTGQYSVTAVTVSKSFHNPSVSHHSGHLFASSMSLMQPASNSSMATNVHVVTASPSLHLKPTRSFQGVENCFLDGIKGLKSHVNGPAGRGLEEQKHKKMAILHQNNLIKKLLLTRIFVKCFLVFLLRHRLTVQVMEVCGVIEK